ncbi:MAG TPA: hypothetical protein VEM93_06225, partial [Actinomycetota bacterium]|nr:hypothetical protein [Actinomycetota bacterium]
GVVSLSTATFDVTGTWTSADPVSGLGVSSDGSLLYVALPTGVEQIDLATGTAMRMFPLPSVQDIDFVGPLGG